MDVGQNEDAHERRQDTDDFITEPATARGVKIFIKESD